MKIIIVLLIAYLIYDDVRERKIKKQLAKDKAECMKRSEQNAR